MLPIDRVHLPTEGFDSRIHVVFVIPLYTGHFLFLFSGIFSEMYTMVMRLSSGDPRMLSYFLPTAPKLETANVCIGGTFLDIRKMYTLPLAPDALPVYYSGVHFNGKR